MLFTQNYELDCQKLTDLFLVFILYPSHFKNIIVNLFSIENLLTFLVIRNKEFDIHCRQSSIYKQGRYVCFTISTYTE